LQNVLINYTMARRFWTGGDALGKRINLCSLDPKPCWLTIVGVVGNVHQMGLDGAPTYDVYFTGGWTQHLVIRTEGDPLAIAAAATDVIHKADPTLPITRVMAMDQLLSVSISPRRFSTVLIGVFACLALLLAAVGIYGVMSYTVGRRTREIGIRMALGAQPANVLRLVLGRGTRLALIGIVAGLAGSFALTRYLGTLLFGVRATDPATFAAVSALLMIVALIACYIPARRAMRVDPIMALREE
jgi:putative ABC transport system permease protein